MPVENSVRVWMGSDRNGTCGTCRRPVTWWTTENAANIPIERNAVRLRIDRHPVSQGRFAVFSRDDVHFVRCQNARSKRR